jgi:sarcosine oxidase subunit gamma
VNALEFLCSDLPSATKRFTPLARSPMERCALAAGARMQARAGFNVAVSYGDSDAEARALSHSAGFCDRSDLGKLELQAPPGQLEAVMARAGAPEIHPQTAGHAHEAWWCPLTHTRALVICPRESTGALRARLEQAAAENPLGSWTASVLDVSSVFAAMTIAGPLAREVIARFCALDLRPASAPPASLRPGSIARQPGIVIVEAVDRYLMLFGWATGEYLWTVVADAAKRQGGRPVGSEALEALSAERAVAVSRA